MWISVLVSRCNMCTYSVYLCYWDMVGMGCVSTSIEWSGFLTRLGMFGFRYLEIIEMEKTMSDKKVMLLGYSLVYGDGILLF